MTSILLSLILSITTAFAYIDEGSPPAVKISPYKPTFFIVGKNEGKGQFSLKARPAEALPLYVGYTQLMIWDIYKSSAPMRDINFNPELFYRITIGDEKELRWVDLGIFEHESNGLNGNSSRSWNRASARFSDAYSFTGLTTKLQWSIKAWVPYGCEGTTCARFRGLFEATLSLENFFGIGMGENDLNLRFYPGGASNLNLAKGGQELTFRLRPSKASYVPLFVIQLFHGYGENMLNQDREVLALRGGIGF